jgi:hypothetical protein
MFGRKPRCGARWIRVAALASVATGFAGAADDPVLGPELWTNHLDGGFGADAANGVAIDGAGAVYTVGTLAASIGTDGFLDKRHADGSPAWSRVLDNPATLTAESTSREAYAGVCVDRNDAVIAVGSWSGDFYGVEGYIWTPIVRKYASDGMFAWEWKGDASYAAFSNARAVTTDAAGNVYAAGNVFGGWGGPEHEWAVWKYDEDGQLQSGFPILYDYKQTAAIPDYAYAIAVDDEGSMIVAGIRGESDNVDPSKRDIDWHVRKYRADRSLEWEDTFAGANLLADYAKAVAVDSNGDAYVAGQINVGTNNGAGADWDGLVVKYAKSTGERLWTKWFGTDAGIHGAYNAVALTPRGLLLAGTVSAFGATTSETYLEIRSTSDGSIVASETYAPGADTAAYAVAQRDGVLVLAGRSQGAANYDALTAAYQSWSPPAPTATTQFLLPTKVVRKVNKRNEGKSTLTISATLDTGPAEVMFAPTGTLSIGDVAIPMTELAVDKRGVWRCRNDRIVFAAVPCAPGSSRCTMTAKITGPEVPTLDPDGSLELRIDCGDVTAAGGCTLTRGAFTLGRGAMPSKTSVPRSAKATLLGPGKDSFSVQWAIAPSEPLTSVSDIVFQFGPTYSRTIPGADFKRRGTVWTYVDKTNARPSMTINSATGFITVVGKKTDLGEFASGPQAVRLVAGPVGDAAVVDVRMTRKNRTLTY